MLGCDSRPCSPERPPTRTSVYSPSSSKLRIPYRSAQRDDREPGCRHRSRLPTRRFTSPLIADLVRACTPAGASCPLGRGDAAMMMPARGGAVRKRSSAAVVGWRVKPWKCGKFARERGGAEDVDFEVHEEIHIDKARLGDGFRALSGDTIWAGVTSPLVRQGSWRRHTCRFSCARVVFSMALSAQAGCGEIPRARSGRPARLAVESDCALSSRTA